MQMRVKVFTSTGPYHGLHGTLRRVAKDFHAMKYTPTLEGELNEWLSQNPAVEIVRVEQSFFSTWFGRSKCLISVWYHPPTSVLTRKVAETLVLTELRQQYPPDWETDPVIITDAIDCPFGWVFSWCRQSVWDSGGNMLGNYPILVDRYNSTLHHTGLEPVQKYIEAYQTTGTTRLS